MALVIENGTGVTGANSYATAAEFSDYVAARDRSIPSGMTTPQIEAKLLDAMDYLNTLTYVGWPDSLSQSLPWPRTLTQCAWGVLPAPVFPGELLKRAQIEAAIDIANGVDPNATYVPGENDGTPIIEDTIGPLTTKYASPVSGGVGIELGQAPEFRRVLAILSPWLNKQGFRLQRV